MLSEPGQGKRSVGMTAAKNALGRSDGGSNRGRRVIGAAECGRRRQLEKRGGPGRHGESPALTLREERLCGPTKALRVVAAVRTDHVSWAGKRWPGSAPSIGSRGRKGAESWLREQAADFLTV